MVRSFSSALVLAALAAAVGCQGEPAFRLAPVEGTVTKGGKPLAGVIVVFWGDPDARTVGPCAIGPTDAAGHYELHTEQGETGAVVGRHRVCILDSQFLQSRLVRRSHNLNQNRVPDGLPASAYPKTETGPNKTGGTSSFSDPPVSERYADQKSTPLRAEVRPGGQVIDLEIE
jgi:hypothetical protein